MAPDPNRWRMSSRVVSRAVADSPPNGSASWMAPSSSRLPRATPTSVIPWRSIIGIAAASSPLAVARIVWVWAVASESVCERVAREKSPKRKRSTTVRHTRRAARSRRARRSTSATTMVSRSSGDRGVRPSARCAPIERRRRPTRTRRGSRLWARAWRCRPDARPSIETSVASASWATSPTVVIPRLRSFPAVTGPTPQSRSTGSGWRKASSPSGGTTSRPSGLATPLATLARNLVLATPTVIGRPTRSRTSARSRAAISEGVPETRPIPRTSRNASSIDSPSTSGVVCSNTSNTALLASA